MGIKTDIGPAVAERRRFVAVQAARAAIGTVLGLALFGLGGRLGLPEILATVWLMVPALLALGGLAGLSLALLERLSLVSFTALIAYLALLTGGLVSPLTVWFALVPAEAALAGGRPAVLRAGVAAAVGLGVVGVIEAVGTLPPARLALPLWEVTALSMLAALVQAVVIAAAAQDRQRTAEAAAAQGAALYRFLADNAMDLITRHSSDGVIRFASPAIHSLLGHAPEAVVGLAPAALVHADDLPALETALSDASYFGRSACAEVRLRHLAGHYVWSEIRCRPAASPLGVGTDIVAVTRDISDRKAQEQALVEARDAALDASRAKSRFLANMSHELRTPLNAIIGFSEIMTREMFGPIGSRYQDYSRLVHESGTHLLDLINAVLDMSKIEAGKFQLHEELFDLEETAQSAVRVLHIPAERAGVLLSLAVAPGARLAFADRRAVKQILVNLLSNAVKYTPPGGVVSVAVAPGRGIEITVSDTGTGISEADLARLGRPFEQVETPEGRAKEGTGLGLALVKSLAAMHGGEALLASTLGEGTVVTVRLPHAAVNSDGQRLAGAKVVPFRAAS